MGFRKTSINAIFWSYVDKFLKRGVSFIVALVLARLLEPSDYGLLAMAAVFLAIGNVFADFGLGQAIIQADEIDDKKCSTIFYINLATGIVIASILIGTSGLIANFYDEPRLTNIVKVISVTYIFNSINLIHGMRFYRELNIKSITTLNIISDVSSGIIGVIFAYLDFGVWSLVYQRVSRGLIYTVLIWVRSKWIPLFYFNFKEIKEMFHFGIGMFGVGLIQEISSYFDTILMGKFMSSSFLGLLDRGRSFPDLLRNTFILPLTRPLFPIFSKIKHDKNKLRTSAFEIFDNLLPVLFGAYGLLIVFSEEIIYILLTDKWLPSAKFLRLFAFSMVFASLYSVSTSLYKALGKKKLLIWLTVSEKVSLLGFLLLGIFIDIDIYLAGVVFVAVVIVFVRMYQNTKLVGAGWMRLYVYHICFCCVTLILVGLKYQIGKYSSDNQLIVLLLFVVIYLSIYFSFVNNKSRELMRHIKSFIINKKGL